MLRKRKIRNSTGATLYLKHSHGDQQALVDGEESDLEVRPKLPTETGQFDSRMKQLGVQFGVTVQLDGSWEPQLKLSSAQGFWVKQTLCSYSGPGYDKLDPKYVDIICETSEEAAAGLVPSASVTGSITGYDPSAERNLPPLVLDLHSTVRIVNETADSLEAFEDAIEPHGKSWLPLMVVATGAVAIRPSSQFTWSLPFRFKTFAPREKNQAENKTPEAATTAPIAPGSDTSAPNREVVATVTEWEDRSYISYAPAECVHLKTDQVWCYSVKVRTNLTHHKRMSCCIELLIDRLYYLTDTL